MTSFVNGQAVTIVDFSGKRRTGSILSYAYKGNVTNLHYWLVQVKGLKKPKLYNETQLAFQALWWNGLHIRLNNERLRTCEFKSRQG